MNRDEFFATVALVIGPPPYRPITATGIRYSDAYSLENIRYMTKLTDLYRQASASFIADRQPMIRDKFSEQLLEEYRKWYGTEMKIRAAAEAI